MTIIPRIESSHVIANLDTYAHTALQSSVYTASVSILEIPPSGITVTIKQNANVIASTSVPATSQQQVLLSAVMNVTASDVISIVVASSNAADAGLNVFKGILNIRVGSI
jgi:hypothetical protein